jgi:hypothetical protein
MTGNFSFLTLFALALGLVFVMPASPVSLVSDTLHIQNPISQLSAGFTSGGMGGLPSEPAISTPGSLQTQPIDDGSSINIAPVVIPTAGTFDTQGSGNFLNSGGSGNGLNQTGSGNTFTTGGVQQTGGGSSGHPLTNPLKVNSIQEFITKLIGELIKVGYVVGVIFIVYAGFLFVTGGEKDAQRTKAKNMLLWTIVGIGILLGAQAIAVIVQSTIEAIANSST